MAAEDSDVFPLPHGPLDAVSSFYSLLRHVWCPTSKCLTKAEVTPGSNVGVCVVVQPNGIHHGTGRHPQKQDFPNEALLPWADYVWCFANSLRNIRSQ